MTKSVSSPTYREFRLLLIEARKKAGLTQTDLAVKLSRPQSYVSKFEMGERRLDVIEFFDIARAIGFDPHHFLKRIAPGNRGTRPKK